MRFILPRDRLIPVNVACSSQGDSQSMPRDRLTPVEVACSNQGDSQSQIDRSLRLSAEWNALSVGGDKGAKQV